MCPSPKREKRERKSPPVAPNGKKSHSAFVNKEAHRKSVPFPRLSSNPSPRNEGLIEAIEPRSRSAIIS